MQKTKIKLVHVIAILQRGGAESVVLNLLEELGSTDYEHHVIYFYHGPHVHTIAQLGIATHRVHGALCVYDPAFWLRLYRILKKIRPDIIHSHLWSSNVASRFTGWLLGIPVINTVHVQLAHQGGLRTFIDRYTFGLADYVVSVAPAIQATLQQVPSCSRVCTVPNGINVKIGDHHNRALVTRKQLGWSSSHIVIGTVGRLEPVKNHQSLVHAFAQVHTQFPHIRLLIIGYGSQEQALRALVHAYGIDYAVQFVIGQSATLYYPLMDLFVLPSHSEGLSMALLEASACGVPSITTGAQGKHDIIEHGISGVLLENPTNAAIRQALRAALMQPADCQRMGRVAREIVRANYSSHVMVTAYKKIYATLLKQNVNK